MYTAAMCSHAQELNGANVTLLSADEEKELAEVVKDLRMLEAKQVELAKELKRPPTLEEWGATVGMTEMRWVTRTALCGTGSGWPLWLAAVILSSICIVSKFPVSRTIAAQAVMCSVGPCQLPAPALLSTLSAPQHGNLACRPC